MYELGGTVPYHRTLRNVINRTIEDCKAKYPNNFIQVKVDAENFQLRVSRLGGGQWYNNIETINLPESALDLSRAGPRNHQSEDSDSAKSPEMEVVVSEQSLG